MHIIQKSNILNIKKTSGSLMSASRDRPHLGGTRPFSGGCFPQRAVTDVMLHKNKKRNEKKTYLTVCTQDDTAHREQGSPSPGPPGSRETSLLTARFLLPREEAVKAALGFSVPQEPGLSDCGLPSTETWRWQTPTG